MASVFRESLQVLLSEVESALRAHHDEDRAVFQAEIRGIRLQLGAASTELISSALEIPRSAACPANSFSIEATEGLCVAEIDKSMASRRNGGRHTISVSCPGESGIATRSQVTPDVEPELVGGLAKYAADLRAPSSDEALGDQSGSQCAELADSDVRGPRSTWPRRGVPSATESALGQASPRPPPISRLHVLSLPSRAVIASSAVSQRLSFTSKVSSADCPSVRDEIMSRRTSFTSILSSNVESVVSSAPPPGWLSALPALQPRPDGGAQVVQGIALCNGEAARKPQRRNSDPLSGKDQPLPEFSRDMRRHRTETLAPRKVGSFCSVAVPESTAFQPYKCWLKQKPQSSASLRHTWSTSAHGKKSTQSMQGGDEDEEDEEDEHADRERELLCCGPRIHARVTKMMIAPNSARKISWDLLGSLLVGYEAVVVPLQFFDPPETPFAAFMSWLIRLFWTCDLAVSFLTGYMKADGGVEMRPPLCAKQYIRSWLLFDLVIISFDWAEVAANGLEGLSAARMGKIMKTIRILRIMRLLRLARMAKLPDVISNVTYRFNTEKISVFLDLVKMMVVVVAITHCIACGWYGIGRQSLGEGNEGASWVKDYEATSMGYRYATSFHWGLTHFGGNVSIEPTNMDERAFAVLVLLCAFFISTFVVSSITTSMTRLHIATAHQTSQLSELRQYLLHNRIGRKLALRVQRNARHAIEEQQKNKPEEQVELLQVVSQPLRVELHYDIYSQVLLQHPLLAAYDQACASAVRQLCHEAVSKLFLSKGDVLFDEGEVPVTPRLYFALSGRLVYIRNGLAVETLESPSTNCAAEASLWTPWVHCGVLKSQSDCVLCVVDAKKFQMVAAHWETPFVQLRVYAEAFVSHLNLLHKDDLTDLSLEDFDIASLLPEVFRVAEMEKSIAVHLPSPRKPVGVKSAAATNAAGSASVSQKLLRLTSPANAGRKLEP